MQDDFPVKRPKVRTNLYFDKELWLEFRKGCLDHEVSASQALAYLMRKQLEAWRQPPQDPAQE